MAARDGAATDAKIPNGWIACTVLDIVCLEKNSCVGGPFGSNLISKDYVDVPGIPVSRGNNLTSGEERYIDRDFVFVSEHKAATLLQNTAFPGDLVFTQRGTIGQIGLIPLKARFSAYVLSQNQMKLRPDEARANSIFLYYYFISPVAQSLIQQNSIGSTIPGFNLGQLRAFPLVLPPILEQRAIAHILGTLDDKIELNRRMSETLEAMARALFKSLFFTDAKGGSDGRVEELLMLSRDTINPSAFPDESFEHYSIPAFDEGREPKTEMGDDIKSNKFLVPQNAVLLSKLNPRFPRIWLPSASDTCRPICSTEFLVAIPREAISREYLYGLFTSSAFSEVFSSLVTGTSGSHQRVKPDYLLAMEVVIPPRDAIRRYTEFAKPLHERIALNLKECRTLARLRDTLLPKLISGELRIPVAEKMVDGAI